MKQELYVTAYYVLLQWADGHNLIGGTLSIFCFLCKVQKAEVRKKEWRYFVHYLVSLVVGFSFSLHFVYQFMFPHPIIFSVTKCYWLHICLILQIWLSCTINKGLLFKNCIFPFWHLLTMFFSVLQGWNKK